MRRRRPTCSDPSTTAHPFRATACACSRRSSIRWRRWPSCSPSHSCGRSGARAAPLARARQSGPSTAGTLASVHEFRRRCADARFRDPRRCRASAPRPVMSTGAQRRDRASAAVGGGTLAVHGPRAGTAFAHDGVMPSILVVDDCQPIAGILARHLRVEGHAVTVAHDGATARALVERAKPDCIFLDLMMPKMTGVELLHELKRDPGTAEIPIVLVSAHIGSGVTHVFSEHEANYSVGKPFTHEQVLAAVAAVLPHAARRAAPRPVVRAATRDPFIYSI